MTSILFLAEEGLREWDGEKFAPIQILPKLELPPGDWRMTKCGDKIVLADASGNNPAMTVDKDGKWEVLNG